MNEPFERDNDGGNIPRQYPIQQGKEGNRSFIQNGFEHFSINPKKTLTVGAVLGILYFISTILSNYKLFGAEIDSHIDNNLKLNQRLDKVEWRLDALKEKTDKQDAQFQDIADWFKNKGKKK